MSSKSEWAAYAAARRVRKMHDSSTGESYVVDTREPAYCGDGRKIEVSMAVWDGITHYLKALHKERAVDDVKMARVAYFPLEHCMTLWNITPYKIQHDATSLMPPADRGGK